MAGMPPIRKWVVCIAGFLQDEGTPGGLVAVWRELHRLHAAPDVRVEFRAWNDRARSLAELLWRLRPAEDPDATTIEPPEVVKVEHTYIDDLRAFHDSAITAAGVV